MQEDDDDDHTVNRKKTKKPFENSRGRLGYFKGRGDLFYLFRGKNQGFGIF